MQILKVTPDLLTQKFCLKKTWCTLKFENHCPQWTLDEIFDPVWFKLKDEKAVNSAISPLLFYPYKLYSRYTKFQKNTEKWKKTKPHQNNHCSQFTEYPSNVFYFSCIIVIL